MIANSTSYLSPAAQGRDHLEKGGRGVFALRSIKKGELLVVWGGDVITEERLLRLPFGLRRLMIQVEEGHYLLSAHEGPADWINHSCDPNAGLSGQIALVAMRPIDPGEEICFDYAMSDSSSYDEFDCHCGTERCRNRVTANDWLLPELQRRYDGYFSPYLQRRIKMSGFRKTRESAGENILQLSTGGGCTANGYRCFNNEEEMKWGPARSNYSCESPMASTKLSIESTRRRGKSGLRR